MANNPLEPVKIPQHAFETDGYTFVIGAIFVYMDGEKMINDPVHVPDIESLSFQCKLNGLVMDGEITFIDRNGIFDKYMTHQNSVFVVSISQGQPSGSGARRSIKTLCEFKHTFIIESVQILNKSKSEMKYKVALVSETWFNVTKPVSFSTHDAPPDQKRVTDILKTTFTQAGLEVSPFFSENPDGVTVDYITTCNDNVMTVFRYMMNKLYQNPDNIDSNMRFVYLDHLSGQYKMLIMNGKNHKVHELKINSTDSGMESIMAPPVTKVDIGTVVRKPTTAIIDSIYGKRMYTYSLESNQIACDSSVGTNTMAGVFGKSSTSQIVPISHQPDSRMMTYSTWDDPSTTYMEFVSDVLEHNSPIIKTSMKLFIELGDVLVITIPDSSDDKEKFSEIQGAWFVSKIVNTFMPSKNSGECYQKLCLVKTKVNRKSSSPLLFFR